MAGPLEGKVALVTGGSMGIGRATAILYARAGAKVAIVDINEPEGQETLRQIAAAGGQATFLYGDVAVEDEVQAAVAQAVKTYGRLDIAFNNAGVEGPIMVPTADYPRESWDRILAVDLTGVWLCMKYEIPEMLKAGAGVIVNMSSVAGLVGDVLIGCAYHSAKFGVVGLTKTAALEYIKKGIRINCVNPGFIDTAMVRGFTKAVPTLEAKLLESQPIGRFGRPEEVGELVVWLSSGASSFLVGAAVSVDGGSPGIIPEESARPGIVRGLHAVGMRIAPEGQYPLSETCPKCGSSEFKKVAPPGLALVYDRLCRACGTRYTPPAPPALIAAQLPLGAVLVLLGLGLVALTIFGFLARQRGEKILPNQLATGGLLATFFLGWGAEFCRRGLRWWRDRGQGRGREG